MFIRTKFHINLLTQTHFTAFYTYFPITPRTFTVITHMTLDCGGVNISNGQVEFTDGHTQYNAVANVTCNVGYDLIGSGEIVCLDTGIWNTSTAVCSIKGKMLLYKSYGVRCQFLLSYLIDWFLITSIITGTQLLIVIIDATWNVNAC